jgi:hypothetical protein
MATSTTMSETMASSTQTIEAFLCDKCHCPIGSVWDVLPAEAHAPAWREHVYCYELDLFANGSPSIQAYSATNPSKRRFDLLRLAPQVTVHHRLANTVSTAVQEEAVEDETTVGSSEEPHGERETATSCTVSLSTTAAATTTTHAPSFVECDTTDYSTEHSFFTGYAWCFSHCSNCGAFLGWGFASEERLRTAAAAARTRTRGDGGEGGLNGAARLRVDAAAISSDVHSAEEAETEEEEMASSASHASSYTYPGIQQESDGGGCVAALPSAGVAPDFIGIIITNCTGEPNYPVTSLLKEIEWRPWRVQRRQRVQAMTRELHRLLMQDPDGLRAHRIYYAFDAIAGQIFITPPATAHPAVGRDDVPPQLLDVLALARASVGQRREHQSAQARSAEEDTSNNHGDTDVEELHNGHHDTRRSPSSSLSSS